MGWTALDPVLQRRGLIGAREMDTLQFDLSLVFDLQV